MVEWGVVGRICEWLGRTASVCPPGSGSDGMIPSGSFSKMGDMSGGDMGLGEKVRGIGSCIEWSFISSIGTADFFGPKRFRIDAGIRYRFHVCMTICRLRDLSSVLLWFLNA